MFVSCVHLYSVCIVFVLHLHLPSLESHLNNPLDSGKVSACSFMSAHPLSSPPCKAFKWEDNTMFPHAFHMHSDEEIMQRVEEGWGTLWLQLSSTFATSHLKPILLRVDVRD